MKVSVVIPTRGDTDLRAVLDALAAQRDAPAYEVLVEVDGAGEGVSVVRNRAAAKASGELLGFLDDDTIPDADWLQKLADALSGPHAAVAGRITESGTATLNRLRALAFNHRHATNGVLVDYLNGGNFGIRTDVFRALGGFNPTYRKSQDRELARRTLQAGHTIHYRPDLHITHQGHYTLKSLTQGRYRAGAAAATMQRNGPQSVGPLTLRTTYGASLPHLTRTQGPALALTALLSTTAHHLGRASKL
ncbi:glycosyltransferase family 2 protein [Kribbella sandramycini]|uniref:glycosyltransferase family 2 protein n=1 Tax=Kribbella sandramycini TaxID=60450 RepID=UPI0031DE8B3F